ncbi:hypothetical protein KAT08_02360 [Candidatus Babeliales bacterium]|nr:hypothetical protein [Candidatus Babeliales bacterium]
MNKTIFFFIFVSFLVFPTFTKLQTQKSEEKEKIVFTSEDVAKLKKQALTRLVKGLGFLGGAAIIYKINQYIVRNSLKYHMIKHMSLDRKQFDLLDKEFLDEIKNQINIGAQDWMNKPWNFELPGDSIFRYLILGTFLAVTYALASVGLMSTISGVYSLWNLPKEGDSIELSPFLRDILIASLKKE